MAEKQFTDKQQFETQDAFEERVIEIARVAKVVKGGRRFRFRVTRVSHLTCPDTTTIPHESLGKVAGAKVFLKPASAGTGVIAAGGVRAVLELAGVRDILTKSMGSANVLNVVMATFGALEGLRSPANEAARRGKRTEELMPFWERRKQHA